MRYKAIIFDFDGVILDSVRIKTQAFADMYRPYGDEVMRKVVTHHLDNGGVSRIVKFQFYHSEFLRTQLSFKQVNELANQFSDLVFKKVLQADFVPGALEFLNEIQGKCPAFVATGTPEEEINRIVFQRNLGEYFREVHGSPATKQIICRDIMKRYGWKNEQVLFVGDSMTDYEAAIEVAINFVGVKNQTTSFPTGTTCISNLMELKEIIK